jgi:fatty acid desaturase
MNCPQTRKETAMIWCLTSAAVSALLLALAAMTARLPRLDPRRVRPARLLRGCLALLFLLIAAGLAGLTLTLAAPTWSAGL